ncbi:MAG: cellobiose phosphorylase, partial [Gammaproteobacteria bacterium]|nr:cellobiose phosphorylase [Gammaproteobacteria bacterium]
MQNQLLTTPRLADLQLSRLSNDCGFQIARLPSGAIFALEHVTQTQRVMVNRCFGSPIAASMSAIYLRSGGSAPLILAIAGAQRGCRLGASPQSFRWQGERDAIAYEVSLTLQPDRNVWLWGVQVRNERAAPLPCDALLVQDLGVGDPGFLMNNEAYASQYLDHHIAQHPRMGAILMARQNLPQGGRHPWVAHGCLQGARGYATDFLQLLGPAWRDADDFDIPFGTNLASVRLQHETACAAVLSTPTTVAPGSASGWTFFGCFREDHAQASADSDLAWIAEAL